MKMTTAARLLTVYYSIRSWIKKTLCWINERDARLFLVSSAAVLVIAALGTLLVSITTDESRTHAVPEPVPIVKAEPIPIPNAHVSYLKEGNLYKIDTVEIDNVRLSSVVLGAWTPGQTPRALYIMIHACVLADVPWHVSTIDKFTTQDRVLVTDNGQTPYIGHRLATGRGDCAHHIESRQAMGIYKARISYQA